MGAEIWIVILAAGFFILFAVLSFASGQAGLDGIKSKPVGNGQYGTARFATKKEKYQTYQHIAYNPAAWREGKDRPKEGGIILGTAGKGKNLKALVDTGDVHCLMIGAAGVGKTAFFLYPNLEFACACGMSFIATDTKGDLARNYGTIAQKYYDYEIAVIDLRNPTQSSGYNFLHLVNVYMDLWKQNPQNLSHKAKAEKYAKVIAKTIISSGEEQSSYGQNAFFYDAAEGLLTSVILLLSEFLAPNRGEDDPRHIVSVFKLIQDLLEKDEGTETGGAQKKSGAKKKNQFQVLMELLPSEHKARWFAGATLSSADQAMASVLSTAMSRLNSFLDTEMEQILCFKTDVDAETICLKKSAIFLVLPEEDTTKYFMASLFLQQFYGEILTVADAHGGVLPGRVVIYADELGTMPKIGSIEQMFSAGRSRRISMVPIIQSFAQLDRNYGKEGSEIITDNCQAMIFGGFAPSSNSAEILSKAMGNQTVLSGSVSKGKNDPSRSLQMIERPLMTPDELKRNLSILQRQW